jgi:rhodanese-related sulfurtransferase
MPSSTRVLKADHLVVLMAASGMGALALLLQGAIDTRQSLLFLIGVGLGVTLLHAAFDFSRVWRNFIRRRESVGLRAQLLLFMLTTLVFFPLLGQVFPTLHVSAALGPVGISVLVGAFLFGIGMELGSGCGSGTLFTVGSLDDIAILNGDLAQWLHDGHKVTSAASKARKGNWVATAERREILASSQDVEQARKKGSAQLMDNRPLDQYLGVWRKSYVYTNGHIPGARAYPNSLLTQPKAPARFLPTKQLTGLAEGLGLDPQKATITYCNSGHLASGGWFILHELMGNKKAWLYDGSMHEWTLEKRPVTALVLEK